MALILVVAGILALAVFLATRSGEPGTRAVAPGAEPIRVAAAPDAPDAAETTKAKGLPAERTSVAPSASREEPTSLGWTVCVVDGSTGAAVVGAAVSVGDPAAEWRETLAKGIGVDTLAGRHVRRGLAIEARTGADGCVHLPTPPERAAVEARHGELWAFTVVNRPPPDGRVVLRLGPERELRVRVTDARGAPVGGVPVALRRQTQWKWTDTEPSSGVATFFHFQRRLEQGTGWHALLAFPVRDGTALPVDASTPVEPPLELVLAETGRVLVRVRAADGSVPELAGVELRLEASENESLDPLLWPGGPWSTPWIDAGGEARVPWIGLDLFLRARLVHAEDELAAASFAGPSRAGEEVAVELRWLAPAPRFVTGRFVLADGRTWPACTVRVQPWIFPVPTPWPDARDVAVDEQGRFRLRVEEALPEDGSLALRFTASHPDGLGGVNASVGLETVIPAEGLDLGDVLLDLGELLAAGRVVDEARRPIADATLRLRTHAVARGEDYWPQLRVAGRTRSGEDGTFSLHLGLGEAPVSDELRVGATAPGYACETELDVQRGERGVELVLARTGALAGSLALGRDLALDDVWLLLSRGPRGGNVPLATDATFEARELLPGTYSLTIRWRAEMDRSEPAIAARVDDLHVLAGETCRDPRIQGLPIESALPTLRIRVVDRAATPLARASVAIVGLSAAPALSGDDGVCLLRCESLPVDLVVSAFGCGRRRVEGVSADRDVVLEPGLPIRLHTAARPSGTAPPYLLDVFLYEVGVEGGRRGLAWGRDPAYDEMHFDVRGELGLRMPEAGVYECEVHVTVLGDDRLGRGARVELSPAPRIHVLATDREQRFELDIPETALASAIAEALR